MICLHFGYFFGLELQVNNLMLSPVAGQLIYNTYSVTVIFSVPRNDPSFIETLTKNVNVA